VKPSTPINIDRLEYELQFHPNRLFVNYLLSGLRNGFHTGIQVLPRCASKGHNLRSARNFPDIVTNFLQEEVDNGFLIGPFSSSPFSIFRVSPLGLVFEKYSRKPRLIPDLSWAHNDNNVASINDLLDKDECSMVYSTIDQAINTILQTGRDTFFLCKCDIASAFKLLPIHPSLVSYYGCCWNDQLYFFVHLPFGGRTSPRIFDCLSQALEWILIHNYKVHYCQHLLDDFLTIDSSEMAGLRTITGVVSG
jgi:hypothetical protein